MKSLLLIQLLLSLSVIPNKQNMSNYNTKVKFTLEKEIQFPDFVITFMGEKSIQGPNNANWSMTKYYFKIKNNENSKEFFWSSGSGRIAPKQFEINHKTFNIELKFSENLNKSKISDKTLLENEFVISKIN